MLSDTFYLSYVLFLDNDFNATWMLMDILMGKDAQAPIQQPANEVSQCFSNDEQTPILPVSRIPFVNSFTPHCDKRYPSKNAGQGEKFKTAQLHSFLNLKHY